MTYQDFKNKYNGKYVDTDDYPKEWKYQCYDLAQLYNTEVLDVPYSVLKGCKLVKNMILWDWKYNELMKYFDEVNVERMQQGDVCIWTSGEGGHIAIFDYYNPDNNQCYYFSQNPNPCQVIPINMDEHHAFRRKGTTPQPIQSEYINIPPSIEARNIYNINTKKQFNVIKPKKFGGLTYKILSYQEGKTYAEIETHDYGKVLVKITDMTPITNTPQYSHGNY